ncbi:TonB-dependent receptor [Cytophagales bacterium LB-30]|uniref:TonB-dependent receptor n=1 Tax=Shiella aurantiaca TaxID=3058365 RepID=A0ABT8F6U9_9BACT|nr:TonB-dependent receptor [Shiella aurantiaca]MDN4166008.1 TonB-dependent receptor [Shiella aurantiaca]
MKYLLFIGLCLMGWVGAYAQHSFQAHITDGESGEALMGATVYFPQLKKGGTSDAQGKVEVLDIPSGEYQILVRYLGYESQKLKLRFPLADAAPMPIALVPEEGEELEEVVITSTRSSRSIDDIPTRVESISGEELAEKGNMKPGEIRMLLSESTGIQTQQTSATSYNSSIRIQGLDGKYTQILRDGLPLYAGFSGGLSLLQIVPLDLQQVEVIKGASSTLYGGGAIAGLVNLISKSPQEERELNFMINGTSALGLDVSGFYGKKWEKVGTTVFSSYHIGSPYDPADIGFTAIPKFRRFTVNPRLFFYPSERTTLTVGINQTVEDRTGGSLAYAQGKPDPTGYFERNQTQRLSSQLGLDFQRTENSKLSFKNSIGYYERTINLRDYTFSGAQVSSFSELNYRLDNENSEWIGGLNLWTDTFTQEQGSATPVDYTHITTGAFIQNTWSLTPKFSAESGLRGDYQNEYGFFLLPRLSLLWKIHPQLSLRAGGGLGYKTPTVFTEDAERIQFRNVRPIDPQQVEAERSVGSNVDVQFTQAIGEEVVLSLNTLFFYTKVDKPLLLMGADDLSYAFAQPDGYIDTRGIEVNGRIHYRDFTLFLGYTLADVHQHYNGQSSDFPLVAKHRLNNVLMYEVEDNIKIGLEAYYFSPQLLNDGSTGKAYWINGLMIEKLWERFSIFINFENFLDVRQTRFDTIYTGSREQPAFRDIYAPVDGFVVNGGLKIKL